MLVVGLTGGISTGKSTVSELLKARNIPVVDADVLAREVVSPGTPGLKAIGKQWPEVIEADGSLDRKKLGSIIFSDEAQRRKLNSIVHPAVRMAMIKSVIRLWLKGKKYCILDVPLLIEAGIWRWVGKVVVVYCSPELQLQRLMKRDRSSREDASSRLKSQIPIGEKVHYADQVIENSGGITDLDGQVDSFVKRLELQASWSWRVSWFPPFGLASALWTLAWRRLRSARKDAKRNARSMGNN